MGDQLQQVVDKPAERYLNWQVIIQSAILGVMAWVGVNIDTIKRDIGTLNTGVTVNATNITHNANEIEELKTLYRDQQKDK
jgi:hypothetical protein